MLHESAGDLYTYKSGFDSGKHHSEDKLKMGVPGIIALILVFVVIVVVIVIVACSYLRQNDDSN